MLPAQKRFLIIALSLFIPLYLFRLSQVPVYQILEDTEVKIRGRISRQPYLKGSYQIIYLGPIMIKTSRFPGYFYGQKLQVLGKLEKRVINRFQAQYIAYFPAIQVIEKGEGEPKKFDLVAILLRTRRRIERSIGGLLPEPQASLLLGILFGVKRQMPQEFWQNLRKTGTLHIVVASGQNVSMVARFLIAILVWLMSRRKALVMAVIGVIGYVLMVGAEAPVVRAGIMAILAYLAQSLGREEEGMIALSMTAGIMLLISPLILFDIGFQLSFAAIAGIIWIYPLLNSFVKESPLQRGLLKVFGEGLATTLSAQLGVLPLLLTNFGQISVLSPLINALVLWVVPIVMALGFILALFALFIAPLAIVLSWFVWLFLAYFVKIINLAGNLPWISPELGKLSFWWGIGYYLALGYFVWRSHRRTLRHERNKTA